jgi:capsule polysaccharide modification protein KpsS
MCRNSGVNVQIIDFALLGQSCMITQEHEKLDIVNDPKGLERKNRNFDQLQQYLKSFDLLEQNKFLNLGITNQEFIQAAKEYLLHSDSENTKTHYTYYGRTKSKVLFHSMMFRIRLKIRESFMNNNLKRTLALPEKFVYFPLHQEQDRQLLITAPFYLNQTEVIKIIAKSLPINFKLVVKDHPMQITRGWRSSSEYKEIMEIPNVILVHPDFSNEELYKNCSLLVTIAGTSGFEATFYGKPVITFVDVNYSMLPSVSTVKNLHELPDLINESLTKKVEASSLDHFITLLEKNLSKFNYADFLKKLKREFFYGGNLVDVEIPEAKMKLFLEKNHSVLSELADEHITKIKWFKNH